MESTFRSPFSYGISNSSKRLPRNGLLIYLARPNSDEYLVGEDTEIGEDTYIWGYVLPDDSDIRAATGWVNGTANVFYTATGAPIVALATEIAAAILPDNVVFSLVDATTQAGKLAIYTDTTTEVTLNKARSVLRDESINRLFYGVDGLWYDPQDLATMYQDAAGTLPVYRPGTGLVDPPVGLMLDKSGGEYHASQNTTLARPTLSGRYNLLTATETLSTQSITTVAGIHALRFEGTGTITLSGTAAGTYSAGTHTITCTAGTLTCTVSGTVTNADLRAANDGVGLPPYQRVVDANTYDTAGFPLYLRFDGVDDFLQTANVDLTGTKSVTGSAGFTPLATAVSVIYEFGPNADNTDGNFNMYCHSSIVRSLFGRVSVPAWDATINVSTLYRGVTAVSTCDKLGDATSISVNGSKRTYTPDMPNTPFSNAPLYVGARTGTLYRLKGRIYQLCIIGSLLSPSEQATLERYLNSKTRAY